MFAKERIADLSRRDVVHAEGAEAANDHLSQSYCTAVRAIYSYPASY